MPRLEELEHDSLQNEHGWTGSYHEVQGRAKSLWEAFSNFALRDNVLEVAVGLIFASAFTAVANSLVTDIILPIISLLPFISRNLDERFTILRQGHHANQVYNTVQQALDDGAVVWAWGNFVDKVLRFLVLAVALFLIAKTYSWAASDNIIKRQVKCKYCRKYISEKAQRCVNCTSWQDGREESRGH
ncbi:large conductance mechanosensitive channel protein [Verruconis gallopava]|uniref:Large conductance mechanosensitive channel protein n=1 Tax=Verruconis gallopava TaxID=253628 RepID=A0A0D1XIK9_9PEZI|nr:large conductance mechanosensitive channel protein [Verruconis gallopava]KIW02161.1 large conductance mechanosensitive channel protein [Verruconis gallopava]